jgi:hypothetical protein
MAVSGGDIPQASTLDDQLGRNVAAAEGVAPATRQPGSGGNIDRFHRCVRPEGRSRRCRTEYHDLRMAKADSTDENLDVVGELWRCIDPGKHRHELPLSDEPRHRVGKGRVISPADQSATAPNQQFDLCVCLHVRRMRTPAAYRADQTQTVDSSRSEVSAVDDEISLMK